MLNNLLVYLFYAATSIISQPNATTVCKTSEVCSIEWEDAVSSHAHLEVQVLNNNDSWVSTTTSGKSFLSVIVSEDVSEYDWFVPQYLGQFWETPKRVVLEDMTTGEQYYSADFTVPGITLDMNASSNILKASTDIPLSWSSNDNSKFGLYLMQDDVIIDTIHNVSLSPNSSYVWNVPYIPNQLLQIMVRSVDGNTYAVTDTFQILETTTTTPTTTISTSTSTPSITNTREINPGYYISIILISFGVIIILILAYYLIPAYCNSQSQHRVSPKPPRMPREIQNMINPVYEPSPENRARPLPPISEPMNFRIIGSYQYPDNNIYEEAPSQPNNINEYNKLKRGGRVLQNELYTHSI